MATVTTTGLKALSQRLSKAGQALSLQSPAFRAASDAVVRELDEINAAQRLAGLDKNGRPLAPVKYRPVKGAGGKSSKGVRRRKGSARSNYGNLSGSEYRKLSGPPLAPRGRASRVISNYFAEASIENGKWSVEAGWKDIKDADGKDFFPGQGPNQPNREIAALSPAALKRLQHVALEAIRKAFIED